MNQVLLLDLKKSKIVPIFLDGYLKNRASFLASPAATTAEPGCYLEADWRYPVPESDRCLLVDWKCLALAGLNCPSLFRLQVLID